MLATVAAGGLVAAQAPAAEKADRNDPSHVAAPFSGVVTLTVAKGDSIVAAQPIATIEAMKLETSITAPRTGTVTKWPSTPCSKSKAATCW